MVTKISSLAFNGIDIIDVDVQVQIEPGMPKICYCWFGRQNYC